MADVGTISGIFRYPVKSMLGETLESTELGIDGIPGDRAWGVRDELRGDFFVGKRAGELMSCRAFFESKVDRGGTQAVPRICLPEGDSFLADSPDAAARVGRVVGREVTLWPVVPEARQATPRDEVSLLDEMQTLMARVEGEPTPDFSAPAPELLEVYARGGPFFDAFPLLLATQRSLDSLAAAAPDSKLDVRRFRPNLLIETPQQAAYPEQDWIGRRVQIGEAVLAIQSTCIRCIMTTHAFDDLPEDPAIMRTIVKEAEGNLGVYATVAEGGAIRAGDSVILLD